MLRASTMRYDVTEEHSWIIQSFKRYYLSWAVKNNSMWVSHANGGAGHIVPPHVLREAAYIMMLREKAIYRSRLVWSQFLSMLILESSSLGCWSELWQTLTALPGFDPAEVYSKGSSSNLSGSRPSQWLVVWWQYSQVFIPQWNLVNVPFPSTRPRFCATCNKDSKPDHWGFKSEMREHASCGQIFGSLKAVCPGSCGGPRMF